MKTESFKDTLDHPVSEYPKIIQKSSPNLMMQGRVSSALKILTSDPCVGVHKISDNVINALK